MVEVIKKYYFFIFLSFVCANFVNDETGWSYVQTTQQCFYFFENVNIDGESATGDGVVGNIGSGECFENFNSCDVLGAFILRDETMSAQCDSIGHDFDENPYTNNCLDQNGDGLLTEDASVCVGWVYASSDDVTSLPLLGYEPSVNPYDNEAQGYMNPDDIPYLKIYDHNNNSIRPVEIDNISYTEYFKDCNEDQTYCDGDSCWESEMGNGQWDDAQLAESFTDVNGDGEWNDAELYYDFGVDQLDGTGDEGEGNGQYDLGEYFYDGNGLWDEEEEFVDTNGNGEWDSYCINSESNEWDAEYDDQPHCECDGHTWTEEIFIDLGNGVYDYAEPYIDSPPYNGLYDSYVGAEEYTDVNSNGVYDDVVSGELLPWQNNNIYVYNGSIDAYNIYGCNDGDACNYNDSATADDGSCTFSPQGDIAFETVVEGNSIEFSWSDPEVGTPEFQYQVKLFDGNNVEIFSQNNVTPPILFEDLDWSTTYTLKVTTTNYDICESLISEFQETTEPIPVPGEVVIDAAVPGEGQVHLSWTSVEFASTYSIWSNGSEIDIVDATSSTIETYLSTELAPGVEYLYQIQAINMDGDPGPLSEPVLGQTFELTSVFLNPVIVGQGQLELSWMMEDDQQSYAGQSYIFDIFMDNTYLTTRFGLYYIVNDLEPEQEYCFHVIPKVELPVDGESLVFSSNQSNTECGTPTEVFGWSILIESQLNAWENELVNDIYNELGMKPEATQGYDPDLDIPEPPVTGGLDYWVSLSFPHPEWNIGIGGVPVENFTTDMRELSTNTSTPLSRRVEVWDVNILSNSPGSGSLTFSFVSEAGGYPVYLNWNDQYSRIYDNGEIDYVYNTPQETDLFNLIVGNQSPAVPDFLDAEGQSRDIYLNWSENSECQDSSEECNQYSNRYPATSYKVYRSWYQETTPHIIGLVGTLNHPIPIIPIQLNSYSENSFEIIEEPSFGFYETRCFEFFGGGDYSPGDDFLDCGWDGICPGDEGYQSEEYIDANNNEEYDLGEEFVDSNFNDIWDENGPDIGEGDGFCNQVVYYYANEEEVDSLGYLNGSYDYGEEFIDTFPFNESWDVGEEFVDAPRYLTIKITDELESSYVDTDLNTGTSYTYSIQSSNDAGDSKLSILASDETAANVPPTADAGEDQIRYLLSDTDSLLTCNFPYDNIYDENGNEEIDEQGLPVLDNVNNSYDPDAIEGELLSYYWEIYDPDTLLNISQPSILSDDDGWWQFSNSELSSIDLPETIDVEEGDILYNGYFLVRLFVRDVSGYDSDPDSVTIVVTDDVPVPAQVEGLGADKGLYHIYLSWEESMYDAPGEGGDNPNYPPNEYDGELNVAKYYDIYRDGLLHDTVGSDSVDAPPTFYIDSGLTPQEFFWDQNGNSVWDEDETYLDENANGVWDEVESHTYYVVARNGSGEAPASESEIFETGKLPIPSITSPEGGEIFASGETATIEWDIMETENGMGSNIIFIDSVSIYHSSDAGVSWTLEESWAYQENPVIAFDFEVPATDTISFYNKFKVEVLDIGDWGQINKKTHSDITEHLIIIANDSLQNSYASGWNLISSPLDLTSTNVWDNFLGDDDEILNFLIYSQDQEVCGFPQCDDQLFDFQINEGFYMISQQNSILGLHGNILESGLIPLVPGWNLIGNPLVARVVVDSLELIVDENVYSWASAIDSGFVLPSIQGFSNEYKIHSPIEIIEPFSGYWIHASDYVDLKIEPHIYDETLYTEQRDESFQITFYAQEHDPSSAMLDLLWNDMIKLGLSSDASDGMVYGEDQYDIPVIVNPASFTNIYIDHAEWEANEIAEDSRFFSDIRTLEGSDIAKTWNITGQLLGNVISDNILLSWTLENLNILDDHEITLVVGENIVNMRDQATFVIEKVLFENMQITVGPLVDAGSCEAQGLVECADGSCVYSIEDCIDLSNDSIPIEFSLSMPYPNPFNPSVKLDFSLPATQIVEVSVYNLNGEHLEDISSGYQNMGHHSVSWNASSYPTGIYFIRFVSQEATKTMKVMLIK